MGFGKGFLECVNCATLTLKNFTSLKGAQEISCSNSKGGFKSWGLAWATLQIKQVQGPPRGDARTWMFCAPPCPPTPDCAAPTSCNSPFPFPAPNPLAKEHSQQDEYPLTPKGSRRKELCLRAPLAEQGLDARKEETGKEE